jgi:hypothetical protein
LISQLYLHSYADGIYLCGDLNARVGNKYDFIEGIDTDVPKRANVDKVCNKYGDLLLDFLKDTKMLIVNGRLGKDSDKYTNVTKKGKSTVDYILTSHDSLKNCTFFDILNVYDELCKNNLQSLISDNCRVPDHSMLYMRFYISSYIVEGNDCDNGVHIPNKNMYNLRYA